jgi:hypothetical protein
VLGSVNNEREGKRTILMSILILPGTNLLGLEINLPDLQIAKNMKLDLCCLAILKIR